MFEIPKYQSEALNRRTDNTMVKRKKNGQNTTQKNKDLTTGGTQLITGGTLALRKGPSSCFTSGARHILLLLRIQRSVMNDIHTHL